MNYISERDFIKMIFDYYDSEHLNPKLLKAFEDITKGLLETERFRGYSPDWKDEMIFESLFHMKRALIKRKFKLEKNINPFSYFNQIAFYSFKAWLDKENNHYLKTYDYYEYINGR